MKKLLLMTIIPVLANSVFAAEKTVTKIKAPVNVMYALSCNKRVVDGSVSTVLNNPTILHHGGRILDYAEVSTPGCEMKKLKAIVEGSQMRYGFVDADAEVTRVRNPRSEYGLCFDQITESIKLDIGQGIVLQGNAYSETPHLPCSDN
jgi:hypothetical protein